MKNKVFIKAGIIVCMIIVGFQHIYGQNNEVRTLDNFNKLTVSGNAKVYLTPGSPQQVRVETKNELKEVKTTVTDGKLKIDGKPSSVYIIIPSVEEINVSGFGEIRIDSTISGNNLILNISGKGKILAPITYSALEGNISGFGKMKLNGTVQKMNLNISGNGTIDAAELKTENANIQISGIAKATVDVKERLDLAITGVGTVYYKTEPKVITKNISGVGKYGVIDTDEPDTTTVHVGKKRIIIIGNEEKKPDVKDEDKEDFNVDIDEELHPKKPAKARSHWGGLDLGFTNYFTDGTKSTLPSGYNYLELNTGKSIHIGLNIFKHDFIIYKRYIMFTTGIGISLDNFRFTSDNTLLRDTNKVVAAPDYKDSGEQISYTKNKLAVSYITVPLLLQFNTNAKLKKSVHFAGGILLAYKYNSHLKLVYDKDGEKQKIKRRDDFNIEPFRYDATIRIGYRNYTLFGSYAISELFKDKTGPTLHPFNVGLQLAGW